MKNNFKSIGLIVMFICIFICVYLWDNSVFFPNGKLVQYKTIRVHASSTCDLTLIPLIEHLRDQSLYATRQITGTDELAISITLYPTSDWKLKKKVNIAFDGLTIYEALNKVAEILELNLTYEDGRFVFRDPDYQDTECKDIFKDVNFANKTMDGKKLNISQDIKPANVIEESPCQ